MLAVHADDRSALLAVYAGWGSPPSLNWSSGTPCDGSWTGVSCTDGIVTRLIVFGRDIPGNLSPALGNVTGLVKLDLSSNAFTESLPHSLSRLTNLRHLNLQSNGLGGSVAPQLSLLAGLVDAQLDDNSFTGVLPPQLSALQNLTFLSIRQNLLTGTLPPGLSAMLALQTLQVNDNTLTGPIPQSFTSISVLSVYNNVALCGTANFTGLNTAGTNLGSPCSPPPGQFGGLQGLTQHPTAHFQTSDRSRKTHSVCHPRT